MPPPTHLALADWRRQVAELYATLRADRPARTDARRRLPRGTRPALRLASLVAHPRAGAPRLPRPGLLPPRPGARAASAPRARSGRARPRRAALGRRPADAVRPHRLGALRGRRHPLPPLGLLAERVLGRASSSRSATRRAARETYGGGRYLWDSAKGADLGTRRRRADPRLQLRLPPVVRRTTRSGPARWRPRRTGCPCRSRPASGCRRRSPDDGTRDPSRATASSAAARSGRTRRSARSATAPGWPRHRRRSTTARWWWRSSLAVAALALAASLSLRGVGPVRRGGAAALSRRSRSATRSPTPSRTRARRRGAPSASWWRSTPTASSCAPAAHVTIADRGRRERELIETIPGLQEEPATVTSAARDAARGHPSRISRTSIRPASSGASLTSAQAACDRSTTRSSSVPQ